MFKFTYADSLISVDTITKTKGQYQDKPLTDLISICTPKPHLKHWLVLDYI